MRPKLNKIMTIFYLTLVRNAYTHAHTHTQYFQIQEIFQNKPKNRSIENVKNNLMLFRKRRHHVTQFVTFNSLFTIFLPISVDGVECTAIR